MPYIAMNERQELYPLIRPLAEKLEAMGFTPGQLNYCVTRLMIERGATRYADLSATRAAVMDAADEYQRRVINPYEDRKAAEAGDIY